MQLNAMLNKARKRVACFFSPRSERALVGLCMDRERNGSRAAPSSEYEPGRFISQDVWICRSRRGGASRHRPTCLRRMLANARLRVLPFRRRHIQSRLVEAFAIEIEIRLENWRDLGTSSVKIENDMSESGVGGHAPNLLGGLLECAIAKQRPRESPPAGRGRKTAPPSRRGNTVRTAPYAHRLKSLSRICLAVRKLSAAIVNVGFAVAPVGNVLLPTR
jgi:hypothetical protein